MYSVLIILGLALVKSGLAIDCSKFGYYCSNCNETACTECRNSKYWGANCTESCNYYCKDGVCNKEKGDCPACRDDKYWGNNCTESCNYNCDNGVCNKTDGSCNACRYQRFWGTNCTNECSSNCSSSKCEKANGKCSQGCNYDRYWGEFCDQQCNEGCTSQKCKRADGTCDSCQYDRWWGASCEKGCNDGCDNQKCQKASGKCDKCNYNEYWGESCETKCSIGCDSGKCTKKDGSCDKCSKGYWGLGCEKACETNCAICDKSNGTCTQCKDGFYGKSCEGVCLTNCSTCTNGTDCIDCKGKNYGRQCQNVCSDNCGLDFYRRSYCSELRKGECYKCPGTKYGAFCEYNCSSTCKKNGRLSCDRDGFCDGCEVGLWGPRCDKSCDSNCTDCDQFTGDCKKCPKGLWGFNCNNKCPDSCATVECCRSGTKSNSITLKLKLREDKYYSTDVCIGTPAQCFSVLVDTSSDAPLSIPNIQSSAFSDETKKLISFAYDQSKSTTFKQGQPSAWISSSDKYGDLYDSKVSEDIVSINGINFGNYPFAIFNNASINLTKPLSGIVGLNFGSIFEILHGKIGRKIMYFKPFSSDGSREVVIGDSPDEIKSVNNNFMCCSTDNLQVNGITVKGSKEGFLFPMSASIVTYDTNVTIISSKDLAPFFRQYYFKDKLGKGCRQFGQSFFLCNKDFDINSLPDLGIVKNNRTFFIKPKDMFKYNETSKEYMLKYMYNFYNRIYLTKEIVSTYETVFYDSGEIALVNGNSELNQLVLKELPSDNDDGDNGGMGGFTIFMIVVGILIAVGAVGYGIYYFYNKRRTSVGAAESLVSA